MSEPVTQVFPRVYKNHRGDRFVFLGPGRGIIVRNGRSVRWTHVGHDHKSWANHQEITGTDAANSAVETARFWWDNLARSSDLQPAETIAGGVAMEILEASKKLARELSMPEGTMAWIGTIQIAKIVELAILRDRERRAGL